MLQKIDIDLVNVLGGARVITRRQPEQLQSNTVGTKRSLSAIPCSLEPGE